MEEEEESERGGKKTAEAIQQEIAREVEQLLPVIFRDQRQSGRLDLEAMEMAVRSAVHRAGAAALTELLHFPAPTAEQPHPALSLWPNGPLPRVAHQARADRRGPGGSLPSLLLVPGLSRRPISRRCRTGHREHGILSRSAPHAGAGGPGGPLRSRAGNR